MVTPGDRARWNPNADSLTSRSKQTFLSSRNGLIKMEEEIHHL